MATRTEDKNPRLKAGILNLIELVSRADPGFKPSFLNLRLTAEEQRATLFEEKSRRYEDLPSVSILDNLLNRPGYRLCES